MPRRESRTRRDWGVKETEGRGIQKAKIEDKKEKRKRNRKE